ncbi:MAG: CBS domain-containing protein [Planctomycetota bacterium]
MRASDIMTREIHVCRPSDTLDTPARIMWDCDCGAVPVVNEEDHIVGIITDRDICMAAWSQGKPLAEIPVTSVMSREVRVCHPDAPVNRVEEIMRSNRVRRVPITDTDGKVIGIVSLNDLALEFANEKPRGRSTHAEELVDTLAAICAHPGQNVSTRPS